MFSVHVVDNPDPESELALLRSYAPSVPEEQLKRLIAAFGSLRDLVEEGVFSYPYSTRELVAIAKHLEKFPGDGLLHSLGNVLSFGEEPIFGCRDLCLTAVSDVYDPQVVTNLEDVFLQHGIPLTLSPTASTLDEAASGGIQSNSKPVVHLATGVPLPPPQSRRATGTSANTVSNHRGPRRQLHTSSCAGQNMAGMCPDTQCFGNETA